MIYPFKNNHQTKKLTRFNKKELSQIMGLYSKYVAKGIWRDYAIDHHKDYAVFSIFRHTAEHPLYTITKFKSEKNKAIQYQANKGIKLSINPITYMTLLIS